MDTSIKRVLCLAVVIVLGLTLVGCSNGSEEVFYPNEKQIMSSGSFHIYTAYSSGDVVQYLSWLDSHNYELINILTDGRYSNQFYIIYKDK